MILLVCVLCALIVFLIIDLQHKVVDMKSDLEAMSKQLKSIEKLKGFKS